VPRRLSPRLARPPPIPADSLPAPEAHLSTLTDTVIPGINGDFYRDLLGALMQHDVPFLVGGGYAFIHYTGIERDMKDFDVFLRQSDWGLARDALRAAGFRVELTFPHWLGKAHRDDDFVDIIYGSGNGAVPVDDAWFTHAVDDHVLGLPVRLVPREELIWSKAYVMERERYDGGDVLHLVRLCGAELDWARLVERFGEHWQVLLAHLVLLHFSYPSDRELVPRVVMDELLHRMHETLDADPLPGRVCRGTLLSRAQFLVDLEELGYSDAREQPRGRMTRADIDQWTAAIETGH
jgi:hypothetical protein